MATAFTPSVFAAGIDQYNEDYWTCFTRAENSTVNAPQNYQQWQDIYSDCMVEKGHISRGQAKSELVS